VPKIPSNVLDCVFYLYRDRQSAERGEHFGGTGFLVGELGGDPTRWFVYGVTNWHVAVRDGFSVMRMNIRGGGSDIIEFNPEDWRFSPKADDVCISPLLELRQHKVAVISRNDFATTARVRNKRVGVGDDVVMIGRFVDHDGGATNIPAARFGNISVMPTPVEQATGATRDTYLIDMHSRTGYSGSPVFVYRTPGNNMDLISGPFLPSPEQALRKFFEDGFFMLLGIHWGQFPEEWKIAEKRSEEARSLMVEGAVVTGLSGMTCVVPADRVLELMDHPELTAQRRRR
jgi:hypothetical protein